tara:strand:- start:1005 stop:1883 length:879 start_codon:yes stop_codon:yes gene_type:complete
MNKIKNNLEEEMISLLSNCMKQKNDINYVGNHPIRVIEAAKSIIGLSLDNPPIKLINYIKTQKNSNNLNRDKILNSDAETVSIYQLENLINENNFEGAIKTIEQLVKLSDGRHVLEYLLEISLKRTGKSLLVIWAIYKTLNFIGYTSTHNVRNALFIAVQSLINDEFYLDDDLEFKSLDDIFDRFVLNDYQLQIIGCLYEILNEEFIREKSIKISSEKFLKSFTYNLKELSITKNKTLLSIDSREDLLGIFEYVKIDDKNILNINALRSYMKNCTKINKNKLNFYITSMRDN